MMKFYEFDNDIYTSKLLIDIYKLNVLNINHVIGQNLIGRIYIDYRFFGYQKSDTPKNISSEAGVYLYTQYSINRKMIQNGIENIQNP